MPHLTLEALARLVDEAPDAAERIHLETCEECRTELEAMREQTMALSDLPRLAPHSNGWPALRHKLRREGLSKGRPRVSPGIMRAAAAVALLLLGGASGWALRGVEAGAAGPAGSGPMAGPGDPVATVADAGSADGTATPAAEADDSPATPAARTDEFEAALEDYMMRNTGPASDPAARLAALDNIVLTTAEALNEAPADPVINGYYMMAQAQRRAVLRQIATSSSEPVF